MITIRSTPELLKLEEASRIVLETLDVVEKAVAPGVTTDELDRIAETEIKKRGARPAFVGYRGYPKTLCTSINDEVVHGIPGGRVLAEGDVISIDCGAIVEGWHGDAAITVAVGEVPAEVTELMRVTEESMWRGIAAAHLIFGGVLDRLPKLQVILPHAGGTLPLVWGRLQRGQKVRPEANKAAKKPVRAYLRRFTYDTISHDAGALRYLIATVGADRVMLGTDFCFDMGYERPRDIVTRQLGLKAADQRRILADNAARLLSLA